MTAYTSNNNSNNSPSNLRGGQEALNNQEQQLLTEAPTNSPSKIRGGQGALTTGKQQPLTEAPTNSPSKIRGGQGALTTGKQEKTTHIFNTPEMKAHRRELRANGTPAERALWNWLKRKQIRGLQFRRQYSVGHHILDFYCPALKLAIELDGDYHYHMAMPEKDWKRDQELLLKHGIKTLRFENNVVFEHPNVIIDAILQEFEKTINHYGGVNAPQPPLILEGELNTSEKLLKN